MIRRPALDEAQAKADRLKVAEVVSILTKAAAYCDLRVSIPLIEVGCIVVGSSKGIDTVSDALMPSHRFLLA